MKSDFQQDDTGHWSAPLPFKQPTPPMPNNRLQAWKKVQSIDSSLITCNCRCIFTKTHKYSNQFVSEIRSGHQKTIQRNTFKNSKRVENSSYLIWLSGVVHPIRFFWYQDNDFSKPLIEYRMTSDVFGNTPSPAVATYGLRQAVAKSDEDVKSFVCDDFYVDDGLTSLTGYKTQQIEYTIDSR
jgi:hypothetical protein